MAGKSSYTPEIGDKIAALLAVDKTHEEIAASLGITPMTIFNWLQKHDDLYVKYQRAKSYQASSIEQQMMDIQKDLKAGSIAPDAARVMINNLQWRAARKDPRAYGDKTILSNDPDNPVGGLAIRLDTAITQRNKMIDVTPPNDGSDLV